MRRLERQYNFLDLANWMVPLGWIFLAGLRLAFFAVNYRVIVSEGAPVLETPPPDQGPSVISRASGPALLTLPISAICCWKVNGCCGLYW